MLEARIYVGLRDKDSHEQRFDIEKYPKEKHGEEKDGEKEPAVWISQSPLREEQEKSHKKEAENIFGEGLNQKFH